ncbi:MAG: hypothetical protein ACFFFK_03700 [Candidatus Thorarchaeota archaeon]
MKKGLKYYLCIIFSELMWPGLALKWNPGIYSFNEADSEAPVLVTVNYYLTVHRVIQSIEEQKLKCHLLVVDSRGINAWCGSRGGHVDTDSVLNEIETSDLKSKVSHKRLILPQLVASAVSKSVLSDNGWRAEFGPVEIDDVGQFLENDHKKTPEQSHVTFDLNHRLEENVGHLVFETAIFLIMTPVFWLLAFLGGPLSAWFSYWWSNLLFILGGTYLLGTFMALADPKMPTSSGLVRGFITGLLSLLTWKLILLVMNSTPIVWLDASGLTIMGLSMYVGFNWGGATPYLGNDQMIRDIAVGVAGLALLFVLGYYFPGGIF